MTSGILDVFLSGLFDYAGMFPPASLTLDEALRQSASFPRALKRPGLVGGDLVVSQEHLAGITPETLKRCGFPAGRPFRICVLGAPLGDPAAPHEDHVTRLIRWNASAAKAENPIQIISYELKIPASTSLEDASPALGLIRSRLRGGSARVFLEPEWSALDWPKKEDAWWAWLDGVNRQAGLAPVGLKVRGAGPTAVDAEALSRVIPGVNARSLPFKATAGLHHPVVDPSRYGNTLGFLNLSAALRLEKALGSERFGRETLRACLATEDVRAYRFDRGLAWRDFSLTVEELEAVLGRAPFSIGSCSITEPDADLQRLFP